VAFVGEDGVPVGFFLGTKKATRHQQHQQQHHHHHHEFHHPLRVHAGFQPLGFGMFFVVRGRKTKKHANVGTEGAVRSGGGLIRRPPVLKPY
jgi:hypothetical protein